MDRKSPSAHVNASRVVIIGSGFGGSVTASRLTEAGFDVTILERGPWRDTLPVKNVGIKGRKIRPPDLDDFILNPVSKKSSKVHRFHSA